MEQQYHYIYKTVCIKTNKFYIGVHSTKNIDDGYLGSGLRLINSIKKYGKNKHLKVILEYLPDRESLMLREQELVNEELLTNPLCMNLVLGGRGGGFTDADRLKSYEAAKPKLLAAVAEGHRNGKFISNYFTSNSLARIKAQTNEAKQKRLDSFKEINHQQGERNSQYGTCWITNGIETKKINKNQLSEYLAEGWRTGRK